MKLVVIEDPIEELERLFAQAKEMPGNKVSHIAVTVAEMKAIVTHGRAKEVIFDYLNPQQYKLERLAGEMRALRNNQESTGNSIPQQELFDKLDLIEKKEMEIRNYIPKSFNQNGIIVKTSLN